MANFIPPQTQPSHRESPARQFSLFRNEILLSSVRAFPAKFRRIRNHSILEAFRPSLPVGYADWRAFGILESLEFHNTLIHSMDADGTSRRPQITRSNKLTGQMNPSGLFVGISAELALRTGFSRPTRHFSEHSFRLRWRCCSPGNRSRWQCFHRCYIEFS
jgi:hypothetical protein